MLKYILKRILYLIPVILLVSLFVFWLLYITPGDPARNILGPSAPEQQVAELREELGLNDPFFVQYGRYISNLVLKGDLGRSYRTRMPVVQEIGNRAGATIRLAFLAITFAVLLGIPIGIISAVKQYSFFRQFDHDFRPHRYFYAGFLVGAAFNYALQRSTRVVPGFRI